MAGSGSGSRNLDKKSIMRRGAKKSSGGGGAGGGGRGGDVAKKQTPGDDDNMNNMHKKKQKTTTTLEELIDAVSDEEDDDEDADDDDDGDDDADDDDADDGDGGDGEDEKRAQALRKMIRDGKFDELLKSKTPKAEDEDVEEDDVDVEEDEDDDDDNDEDGDGEQEEEDKDDDEQDEAEQDYRSSVHERKYDEDDNEDSSSDEENNEQQRKNDTSNTTSVRSLALHTSSLSADRHLPWPESFAVSAVTPLPFKSDAATVPSTSKVVAGVGGIYEEEMDAGGGVDVHDDLAREVAFYDTALECTTLAREQCDKFGIPFARPEDFFAEMVKSDDHMAKIKDRLIYETKKMDAVQRRKSNKEHTLVAKERNAHRLAEKAKAKKAHMSAVDDWKKDVERNRGRHVGDANEDEGHLRGMMSGGGGPSKRRESANKRYGFGGKNGRFKQNDRATLNDMSGFNPRGGFAGGGRKSPGGGGGSGGKKRPSNNNSGGGGKKRPGKRARDSARSR